MLPRWLSLLLSLICLTTALVFTAWLGWDMYRYQAASLPQRLQILWQKDLEALQSQGKLPLSWNQIADIEVFTGTNTASKWAEELKPPISTKKDGTHRLEILLLSWEDGDTRGAVIQYNIVNRKTDNMEWELGRTFVLEGRPIEELGQQPAQNPTPEPASNSQKPVKGPTDG